MFQQAGRGYDMASTMFSPEGRLFQIEYAIEAVRRGSTAIVCRNNESVVFAVEKKSSELQDNEEGSEKIFKIDDHVACSIAGLTADARVLVDRARVQAQVNILSYDEKISVKDCTLSICEYLQAYTMN
mgnify:CR=1 FL=1